MEVCSGVQRDIFTVPMTMHWKFDATQADQRTAVFSSLAVLHQLALDSPAFQWLVSCPRSPQRSGSELGVFRSAVEANAAVVEALRLQRSG